MALVRMEEAPRRRKWDARRTAGAHTIGVVTRRAYGSPEDALAGWKQDRCGLPQHVIHWDRIMKIKDLVLIIKQREERAKAGWVEILTVDLRGQPR